MKILKCYIQNFASYKELRFEFSNQGLTLIQGATGAGKSTLCDAIPWILWGRTAKDGAVDEVVSWNATGDTWGMLEIELNSQKLIVTRLRKGKQSDLSFSLDLNQTVRGKDVNDTQKLLNNLLGLNLYTYLTGSYFHEFSQTADFFITTAKNRRVLCDQLVDLTLANTTQKKVKDYKSDIYEIQKDAERNQQATQTILDHYKKQNFEDKANNFKYIKESNIKALTDQLSKLVPRNKVAIDLGKDIAKLEKHLAGMKDGICEHCGNLSNSAERIEVIQKIDELKKARWVAEIDDIRFNDISNKLKLERDSKNVYYELEKQRLQDIIDTNNKLEIYENTLTIANQTILDLELLTQVLNEYRGVLIVNTASQLQTATNNMFRDYFDSDLTVEFDVTEADKLDVILLKNNNRVAYTQLSKGQRQLLKLCFSVAVMQILTQNQALSFNCLFFDEALSGLDAELKAKAFRLLENVSLNYESVFVVDHSEEFKNLFNSRYDVTLTNGWSVIEKSC